MTVSGRNRLDIEIYGSVGIPDAVKADYDQRHGYETEGTKRQQSTKSSVDEQTPIAPAGASSTALPSHAAPSAVLPAAPWLPQYPVSPPFVSPPPLPQSTVALSSDAVLSSTPVLRTGATPTAPALQSSAIPAMSALPGGGAPPMPPPYFPPPIPGVFPPYGLPPHLMPPNVGTLPFTPFAMRPPLPPAGLPHATMAKTPDSLITSTETRSSKVEETSAKRPREEDEESDKA